MYILILIVSLKSQFNHALDVYHIDNIYSKEICLSLAEETSLELKRYDKDVETKYICKVNSK